MINTIFNCLCVTEVLSLSQTFTILATIHHDSSRFELDGKFGVHRVGKKENPASILCLTMLLRCLHDSSTVPLRFMTAALRFTTVELLMLTKAHDASEIRYGASTVQAGSATTCSSCRILDESACIGAESGCQ